MKQSLILIAGALALSAVLAVPAASYADVSHLDDVHSHLQDELVYLAKADHNRAAENKHKHAKGEKKQHASKHLKHGHHKGKHHHAHSKSPELARQWRDYQHKRDLRHRDLGRFADLFLQPAWPVHAQYVNKDQVVSVDVKYSTATTGFNNSGIQGDVARTSFADGDIKLQDVLLASKLVASQPQVAAHTHDYVIDNTGAVAPTAALGGAGAFPGDSYLGYLADKPLVFNGQRERIEAGFNFARYFFSHRIGVGVFVPVVQDKRSLNVTLDYAYEDVSKKYGEDNRQQAYTVRYGSESQFIADAFNAKGLSGQGGTTVGLGDLQLYAQVNMASPYLERALFNIRAVIPTASQAATNKLWAPELGNGGFYQAGLSFAAAGRYSRYFNPHYSMEGVYSLPATTNQRVPKKIAIAPGTTSLRLGEATPLGYRLDTVLPAASYNGYDVQYRGFGDTVSSVKIARGLQFDMRVGNVFENVFVRRGFLDVFYNFKIKARDRVYNVAESDYMISAYQNNSDQLEHRIGGEWRWQVNHHTTLRVGVEQVVRGKNVAQDTQIAGGVNYGF
jgi:hypothetical protein